MSILRLRQSSSTDASEATGKSTPSRFFLRRKERRRRARERKAATETDDLDLGLAKLNQRLGGNNTDSRPRVARSLRVEPTARLARSIYYSSDLDGHAEPGEVVWVTVPSRPPQERSMLVIGRQQHKVLGLLISSNSQHSADSSWLEIGSGEWGGDGARCWLRLDKTMIVPEIEVSRRGILFPQRRFNVVANRLRSMFNWA
ncbi:type II toxin-antitoxin system PemK/MazF family toxin [Corynebacterium cystitidis]|uniref:type II toxin-antitoxin system PemK/MazF family toxin n=1 Tax=Corynebacterium cystitidis TaxID=35757 RepID=UPI00211E53B3|nr:hypothetical protein [Corynebacterium cystitidis]